ncbi:MAG: hypothetical protein M3Z32_02075 [Acidobacteriota bacterium]|nr:hypothetical protein [Acidobacteriota bacterium]
MSVPLPLVALVVFFVAVLAYFVASLVRRSQPNQGTLADVESDFLGQELLETDSVQSYRPMERLLNEADFEFLAKQPGFDPRIARTLRAERRRIFRTYLHCLIRDFNALVHLAQLAMVHSAEDRPELASAIFRLRVTFFWNVACAEVRLALAPLPLGSINTDRLIGALESIRENLQQSTALAES